MNPLTDYRLSAAAKVLNVTLQGEDVNFTGVSTDTRSIKPGELFVALQGVNFDGHDHIATALANGAVAAVVSKSSDVSIPQLKVTDTKLALADLARSRRAAFNGKVIGITGSNGKTTVKELLASILKLSGKVLATKGNLNNDIGLPLTLLTLQNNEAFAVIEMGANHPKEIAFLTRIATPDVALITNAGAAPLEGFGSVEGVAKAKAEIFEGLSAGGTAIINNDDQYAALWKELTHDYRQIKFAIRTSDADVKAADVTCGPAASEFTLQLPAEAIIVRLPLSGLHNISNALAAAAAAHALGIRAEQIKHGLENFKAVPGRLNISELASKAILIDDTYNANLESTKAAIDVLASYQGRRILVIGDLFESGENEKQIHQALGEYAKNKSIDELLAIGDRSVFSVNAFGEGAQHFTDKDAIVAYLKSILSKDVVILVKGSRGMRMEDVVRQFK